MYLQLINVALLMICIHSTKKLLAKLPVDKQGNLPSANNKNDDVSNLDSPNPLSDWHANLIILQRRNCILLVHDQTRFPLFIPCLTKPDFAKLQRHFEDVLMNTLLKLGASHKQMETASQLLQTLEFDTNCNRSVQGTMNQMAGDIEHSLYFDDADVQDMSAYRTGVWLANRPCTIKGQKGCVWPDKAILELLDVAAHLAPLESSAMLPDNVVSMEGFKNLKGENS